MRPRNRYTGARLTVLASVRRDDGARIALLTNECARLPAVHDGAPHCSPHARPPEAAASVCAVAAGALTSRPTVVLSIASTLQCSDRTSAASIAEASARGPGSSVEINYRAMRFESKARLSLVHELIRWSSRLRPCMIMAQADRRDRGGGQWQQNRSTQADESAALGLRVLPIVLSE